MRFVGFFMAAQAGFVAADPNPYFIAGLVFIFVLWIDTILPR